MDDLVGVIDGYLGNDDLPETIESSYSARIRVREVWRYGTKTFGVDYAVTYCQYQRFVGYAVTSDGYADDTVEAIRRRSKWENDDYICRGHILNDMSDSLFDIYQNVESAKELWDSLESKYMAEDASSKKFLVGNFNNYKMVDSRHVMEQFNELLRILRQYTQHGLKMDESISVSSVIDKLPPSWKDFKHT
ncbi:hypothetical protein Tco_1062803 [Tanacetum coccineum]